MRKIILIVMVLLFVGTLGCAGGQSEIPIVAGKRISQMTNDELQQQVDRYSDKAISSRVTGQATANSLVAQTYQLEQIRRALEEK